MKHRGLYLSSTFTVIILIVLAIAACFRLPKNSSLSLCFEGKTVVGAEVLIDGVPQLIPDEGTLVVPLTKPASVVIEGVVWKKEALLLKPGDSVKVELVPESEPRAWIVEYKEDGGIKSELVITQAASAQAVGIRLEETVASFTTVESTYTLFSNGRFVGWTRFSITDASIVSLPLPSTERSQPLEVLVVGIQLGEPVELFNYCMNGVGM